MSAKNVIAPSVYFDKHFDKEAAKILPGEYYVTGRDMLIVTVLGSCVSACIRDVLSGIGGMNHFMLPDARQDETGPLSSSARYGTHAMEILINQILKAGGRRDRLEAKVFGGGQVLKGFMVGNVGEQNASFVKRFLKLEDIPIVAEDLLDVYPRKVYFFPNTGKVMLKKLKSVHNNTIVQREREYSTRIRQDDVAGDVDLF
ncbi:chemoreceptor glutamine deamidase CheD [Chitinimonas sp. PSY-7]|uniref:chemoreceptor glutamine deamidase CheD n=1 Tax=Chitinimonas sp. PSY-7 TaxID=3459088 RepID=UPI0040402873